MNGSETGRSTAKGKLPHGNSALRSTLKETAGKRRIPAAVMAMLLLLAAAFMLTACRTETKTLQDYLADSPSAQQEIEESLSGLQNSDMDVSVDYDQNQIIITCDMKTTYKKEVRKAIKKSYRKYMKKNLTDPMESAIARIEQETGITGVTIMVTVNNGNGKKIWSQVYPLDAETETPETQGEAADSSGENGSE